jgi:hypothetical protein
MARKRNGYDTGLAGEFYVLACLHRLGMSATLTLGNQKAIDLVVLRRPGDAVTIDVKGVADKQGWITRNLSSESRPKHFLVLISFEGKIGDLASLPLVWVLPYVVAAAHVERWKDTFGIRRKTAIKELTRYRNAWHLLLEDPPEADL